MSLCFFILALFYQNSLSRLGHSYFTYFYWKYVPESTICLYVNYSSYITQPLTLILSITFVTGNPSKIDLLWLFYLYTLHYYFSFVLLTIFVRTFTLLIFLFFPILYLLLKGGFLAFFTYFGSEFELFSFSMIVSSSYISFWFSTYFISQDIASEIQIFSFFGSSFCICKLDYLSRYSVSFNQTSSFFLFTYELTQPSFCLEHSSKYCLPILDFYPSLEHYSLYASLHYQMASQSTPSSSQRLSRVSHVDSALEQPFQCIKNHYLPSQILQLIMSRTVQNSLGGTDFLLNVFGISNIIVLVNWNEYKGISLFYNKLQLSSCFFIIISFARSSLNMYQKKLIFQQKSSLGYEEPNKLAAIIKWVQSFWARCKSDKLQICKQQDKNIN